MSNVNAQTEAFMARPIKEGEYEDTPANMLLSPGADIGLTDAAEQWVGQIVASDDPDAEFGQLIDHLSGVLANVELVQKHYRQFIERAA